MLKPLVGVLLSAAMLLAQAPPSSAPVSVPPSEEKAIITAIADFYKANSQYRDRAEALAKERTDVLTSQRQRIEALKKAIETAYKCSFDLDTYVCSPIPSPEKSPQ